MREKKGFFILSAVALLLDQFSKYYILKTLEPYTPIKIWPMLDFTLVYNTGSAFSFLSNSGAWHYWFFLGFGSFMSIVIFMWMLRLPMQERRQLLGLALILGGALGNLFDRVNYLHVIDFIDLYYNNYHWPVFNVADSFITIGAAILIFSPKGKELNT